MASLEGYATCGGRGIHRTHVVVYGAGIAGYAAVLQWLENTGISMEDENSKAYSCCGSAT